jgi:hypothetical protein
MQLEIIVRGWSPLQKIIKLVFNRFGVKIFGLSIGGRDVEMDYMLATDEKIRVSTLHDIKIYITGISDCLKSF